jgi:hypothetical protein
MKKPFPVVSFDRHDHDLGMWSSRVTSKVSPTRSTCVSPRMAERSITQPAPADNGVVVVDTNSWIILKQIDDAGRDAQTLAVTNDGKDVFTIFSSFQRFSSGMLVIDVRPGEPMGNLPSADGHHDCVIVPRTNSELSNSRSTTL